MQEAVLRLHKEATCLRELSKLVDTYLVPQELEKKKNAEVSTPFCLRQEMLDVIPSDFWTQPQGKHIDIA